MALSDVRRDLNGSWQEVREVSALSGDKSGIVPHWAA